MEDSSGGIREEMVANGVAFLLHPRVQAAPLSQRIVFLEKKGLSQEEVAEALARVKRRGADGGSSNTTAPLDQLYDPPSPAGPSSYGMPPPPYPGEYMHDAPPPPPPPPPMWHQPGVMLPGAVVAGLALGAGAAHLIRLRRQQEEQQEREQRMLEMEFRERQRQHQQQRRRFEGEGEGDEEQRQGPMDGSGTMHDGPSPSASFAEEEPPPPPLQEEGLGLALPPPPPQWEQQQEGGLSMKELARAIETQAAALTALAQASERSRQDLHALLTGQVAAQTADIRAELSTIKQVLLLSASASAGSSSSSMAGLLEASGGGGRLLALMAGSASGQVEALPTPSKDEEAVAAAASGEEGGSGSAFSSPAKGEKKEEEEEKEEEESEEAKATREAAEAAQLHRRKVQRLCAALRGLREGNPAEALKGAADMLLIYVNNLIKYPTVPRFRKVALVNQGYKERVAKVQGHEEFLRALGYAEGSACFEWEGHLASGQEAKDNVALLQKALALLTAVKKGEEPAWPADAADGATEGEEGENAPIADHDDSPKLDEARLQALLHPNSPPSSSSSSSSSSGAAGQLPAQEQPAAAGENKTDSAPASPLPTTTAPGEGDGGDGAERQEGQQQQQQQQQQPQPQYPKSFMEIMQMAERGETPAGIQQVEDRLSSDVADGRAFPSAALSSSAKPVPKPWEEQDGAGEGKEEEEEGGEGGEAEAGP